MARQARRASSRRTHARIDDLLRTARIVSDAGLVEDTEASPPREERRTRRKHYFLFSFVPLWWRVLRVLCPSPTNPDTVSPTGGAYESDAVKAATGTAESGDVCRAADGRVSSD